MVIRDADGRSMAEHCFPARMQGVRAEKIVGMLDRGVRLLNNGDGDSATASLR